MLTSVVRRTRFLLRRALEEHASPGKIGLAVGLGMFCGCTPFIGLHIVMALALATVFRVSRLWAVLGSRAVPWPALAFVAFAEVELSHRLRTGGWAPMAPSDALAHGHEYLVDWLLGTPIVGGIAGLALGLVAYAVARLRQRRLTARTPAGPPPSSSESLP